jgi:hypothetical protein
MEEHIPSESKALVMSYWTIVLKHRRITVMISKLGPFTYMGHSSGTKQSATWRE